VKPRIGISCAIGARKDEWVGQPGRTWDYLKHEYYLRIEEAGGVPILLPNSAREETVGEYAPLIDGLLLSGGEDVHPSRYGDGEIFPGCEIHPERDAFELALLRSVRDNRRPVLAICRGIQLMNVCFGGSLYQDLSLRTGTGDHKSEEPGVYLDHPVRVTKGTRLFYLAGQEDCKVNSRHHQLLRELAPGFVVSALAPDGVIEAVEWGGDRDYLMGVQWHPELMLSDPFAAALFRDFVAAADARRKQR